MNEDVFPIEHGNFPASHVIVFRGVNLRNKPIGWFQVSPWFQTLVFLLLSTGWHNHQLFICFFLDTSNVQT